MGFDNGRDQANNTICINRDKGTLIFVLFFGFLCRICVGEIQKTTQKERFRKPLKKK